MPEGGGFDSLFFMNVHKSEEELRETAERILNDPSCGDVFRVKGFLRKEDGQWLELNATAMRSASGRQSWDRRS